MGKRLEKSQISSNLFLQMLMYYHRFYSLVYFFSMGRIVLYKMSHFVYASKIQEALLIPVFVIWSLVEAPRFFFGFNGNLQERVPQMSAFIIMSVFPQLPCILFLTFAQEIKFPFDMCAGVVMLFFLIAELILGVGGLKTFIAQQTAQFYRMCQDLTVGGSSSSSIKKTNNGSNQGQYERLPRNDPHDNPIGSVNR